MLFQKSRIFFIYIILVVLFISLLFNSCLTTSQSELIGESKKSIVVQNERELIQYGNIYIGSQKKDTRTKNSLQIIGFSGITKYCTSFLTFINEYGSSGYTIYNGEKNRRSLSFAFDERISNRGYYDSPDDYSDSKGSFTNIKIKKFPQKHYKFEIIDNYGMIQIGSQLEKTNILPSDLPVYFTSFYIDEKKYSILLTKIKVDYPLITNMPKESFGSSVRKMIRLPDQEYLVIDSDNKICASFSYNNYKIYEDANFNSYDMIQAIGIYLGIFKLLNSH